MASPPLPVPVDVELLAAPFNPLASLAAWQAGLRNGPAAIAAAEAHFIGRVRPVASDGAPLEALEIEHYPGMSERRIAAISQTLAHQHGVAAVLVRHRVGRIKPGEPIVVVAVAADRRGPALRCCQELLETLKHEAPFWKREWVNGCGQWVAGNTPL
ncbi:MAG: molybdenum cofactor biosynthesis protein MoaE [Cyanobacteria bacterium]|nr:molybdenum cofactor biosynthesis protein MoaE [Cyanobacteriota bacterium]